MFPSHDRIGAVKRVSVTRDPSSFKRNLNLYIISENDDETLVTSNSTIKENLKQWLTQGKMLSDTIDILDAKIINIGINFTLIGNLEANKFDVLSEAISELESFYNRKFEIGQPFYVSDIYSRLNKLDSVIDVTKVEIVQKLGTNYSNEPVNILDLYSADGSYIDCPKNAIFEIKFPDIDIKGTIK